MISALLLSLTLQAADPGYKCKWEDIDCWRAAALAQEERAEHFELKAKLESSAREIAERMTAEEIKRGDRWKDTALAVAPRSPMFFETPIFWGSVGVIVGVLATVGVAYAVRPATR